MKVIFSRLPCAGKINRLTFKYTYTLLNRLKLEKIESRLIFNPISLELPIRVRHDFFIDYWIVSITHTSRRLERIYKRLVMNGCDLSGFDNYFESKEPLALLEAN